ncbi:Interphotoreceptor retinol-binding [Penicillium taxi]|uniref:Interphotoreceptor retinol-binding n=1 Tax=Penicillium taxi TaxID=168475 RepID=UPI0025453A67|nr:Interphotoreceptor retinol-binding [Penicillium taxi]KAJ5887479.1 Interphotoreceptor retinol-binding [Penicillium taxi]
MYLKKALLVPVVLATIAEAGKNARDVEPCAQIAQSVADANQRDTSAQVSHDLAHQCLMSMPFDPDRSAVFLNQVRKILEFQSTVDILKDPPSGYKMPSTDLLGGIESIINKANSNGYSSQFEMDLDVYHLANSAYDGHLAFGLCSQSIFTYNIDLPLVSISTDGLSLPQVYTLNDAKAQEAGSTDVSSIKTINGTDVARYLESYALGQTLQDPDAQYNRLFPALVRSITGTPVDVNGIWASTADWKDGSEIIIKYENGTSQTIQKTATPKERFFDYQNGTALFKTKCLPQSSSLDSSTTAGTEEASGVTGLPSTTWSNSDYSIAGFFSNLTSLQDTGILFVPTFSSNPKEIAQMTIDFLHNATLAGKKNILIDVTGNPGGYLTIGIDMARIFFPDVVPYTATRFRAHDAAKYLTKAYSQYTKQDSSNPFAYRNMVTPNQTNGFSSWQDLYGPHEVLGSSSSSLLANFNYSSSSTAVYPINGYGSVPLNPAKSLFSAADIAIITNGDCVSTCATFVKLMKRQGVRTIAFGGQPSESPMQGVGGVKGGQSLGVGYINGYIQIANELIQSSANTSSPLLTRAEWTKFNQSTPSLDSSFSWNGNVNLRNEYDPDDDQTPLQFVYEAAECRLFYKLENYLQQETVWQAAAKAMFGDGECVKGSTNGEGSLSA